MDENNPLVYGTSKWAIGLLSFKYMFCYKLSQKGKEREIKKIERNKVKEKD